MQVYSHQTGKYICQNKYFGRTLNQETFFDSIEDFFKYNDAVRCDVIHRTLANIKELLEIISKLETYRFYTSSLLITYDGNFTKGVIHKPRGQLRGRGDRGVSQMTIL